MRYRITIERIEVERPETVTDGRTVIVQVYQQSFDELNVAEMITRLNHQPRKRKKKGEK